MLDRIFRSNMSTPNFITILLGRSEDPTDPWPGDVTIGEILNDFENVTSQPKLAVTEVKTGNGQHWQALLDPNGVIGPDGQPIKVSSKVKNSDKTRLNAVFDTGFSLSQVPKSVFLLFFLVCAWNLGTDHICLSSLFCSWQDDCRRFLCSGARRVVSEH